MTGAKAYTRPMTSSPIAVRPRAARPGISVLPALFALLLSVTCPPLAPGQDAALLDPPRAGDPEEDANDEPIDAEEGTAEEGMDDDPFGERDFGEGEDAEEAPDDDSRPGPAVRVKPLKRRGGLLPIDMKVDRSARIPPAAPFHMGREIAQTMHYTGAPWLVRESRQREEDCRMMIEALGIRPGQKVCDLGAGNGFYTLELARLVGPEGLVYAVDIQPEMLRMLSRRAAQERVSNIRLVLGSPIDPRLPAGEIDLVLCVDVYHEFSHPEAMLSRIRESLSEEGRLVLVEFRGEDPAVPIKPLHKMTKAQVRAELEPAGFGIVREFDRLPWQHLIFLGARDRDSARP